MRVVIVCLAATFLVLVAPSTSAQEEEKECFTTEWAMDLIPCFVNRFIELVNLNDTDTSSLSQTEMKGPWSHHDPTTRRSRMYGPQNDMHRFFQDLKYQMAHDVGTVHPHSMTQKYRMDAVKKIQKIDFDAVYDHAVDQAVASVVTARRSAEVVLEAAVQAKVIPDYGTLDLSDSELDVICALAPSFVPGLNTPLCKVGIRVLECLHKYSDTDYEHSLKWAKCLFECEDLPFLSQCVVDQFEGCGLSWPISDLSWLGAILVRGFVDYIEMDTCVFEFEQPLNLTETIELEEGGPSTTIAFRQYLHPSVHCIDLGMLSSPIGIVGGMLQWIKGEIGTEKLWANTIDICS